MRSLGALREPRASERVLVCATPAEIVAWCDRRIRRMGLVPARERPDARFCPTCGGRCYTVDADGRQAWCTGECRRTGVVQEARTRCAVCREGDGWVVRDGGRAAPCPACAAGTYGVAARLRAAGIPVAFQGWTFRSFEPVLVRGGREDAWQAAGALTSDVAAFTRLRGAAGLYLWGPPGGGKTGLAASSMNSLAQLPEYRLRWLAWRTWLGELRHAMRADHGPDPDMLVE